MAKKALSRVDKLNLVRYAIDQERIKSENKHGVLEKHVDEWFTILVEEIGEVAKAINEQDGNNLWDELAQVGAVVLCMMTESVNVNSGSKPEDNGKNS